MASTHSLLLFVVLLLAVMGKPTLAQGVPAMFVFGDSTADVGNNNFIPGQVPKADFAFNGVDFPGGARATGRFSNGLNGIDYLAQMVGFQQSPPPVLSIRDNRQILRGASFASAGSGILNVTGQNMTLNLTAQEDYMRRTVEILSFIMGRDAADRLVAGSLYIISTGNNDLLDYFRQFGPAPTRPASSASHKDQYIQLLATAFRHRLQGLYSMGARRFVVIGIAPLGCVPTIRSLTPTGDCVEDLNDMAQRLNRAVLAVLNELASRLTGMRFSFVDAYSVLSKAIARPDSFGYNEIRQACCGGAGRLNADAGCSPNAAFVCRDRNRWMFWDRVHPTQSTYWLVASNAFSGDRSVTMPVNVQELVRA